MTGNETQEIKKYSKEYRNLKYITYIVTDLEL